MTKATILYRKSQTTKEEFDAAKLAGFHCTSTRLDIQRNDIVIGRYSVLPFYEEIEQDITQLGGRLINSQHEHSYVADLKNYVEDLKELTPKTWFNLADVPRDSGPFILKGATNSKKQRWNTHCFAKDWKAAVEVHGRLLDDGFICYQEIYIREYVPLEKLGEAIGGLPLSTEFRFFVCNKKILCGGFYWDAFSEDIVEQRGKIPDVSEVPKHFLDEVVDRIGNNITFYAVDVARTANGKWIVIELNDGQQSGLSGNDAETLYKELYQSVS